MIRRALALIGALVLSWLGPFATSSAVMAAELSLAQTCAYSPTAAHGHYPAAQTERGPPARYGSDITYDSVDHWSRGASARPAGTTSGSTTNYTGRGDPVQVIEVAGMRVTVAGVDVGDLSSLAASDVAAEDVGLSARGLRPLPGTRVRPQGIPTTGG